MKYATTFTNHTTNLTVDRIVDGYNDAHAWRLAYVRAAEFEQVHLGDKYTITIKRIEG